ncbi:MAG: riboflavin synthase [Armatimonadetes bacterium]|nr:riboflavin synthase [Armatimonadota bacterium]MDW8121482.1 riboflavin synthase [Armatimonadota bacterium]
MFTGIVEGTGVISHIERLGKSLKMKIRWDKATSLSIGDSICVDGVCLTILCKDDDEFQVQAVEETLKRTTLGQKKVSDKVNLERAMPAFGRFGGHFVQGHIDGTGVIRKLLRLDQSVLMVVEIPRSFSPYIAPKGSIAVDGVSLTVVEAGPKSFSVSLIPYTLEVTTLGLKKVGDRVNIETDILAKYVVHLIRSLPLADITPLQTPSLSTDRDGG